MRLTPRKWPGEKPIPLRRNNYVQEEKTSCQKTSEEKG